MKYIDIKNIINDQFIEELKLKREEYGVSQKRLAVACGISREHYNRIETGKLPLTEELKAEIQKQLERFNPLEPMFILVDYFRVRFPTTDPLTVIKDILHIKPRHMLHEEYGRYGYEEQYILGDITVLVSSNPSLGVLLELKGKGCRQIEGYLLAQQRSWFDLMMDCLTSDGVIKRLDLAINDRAGILDIPELTEKCNREECISVFRSFKSYASGELIRKQEQDKAGMGHTLYIGSLKSEVYFCCYEKNYEQYAKLGIPVSEALIKNRFEIRLKNERAYYAVRDLLTHYDAERTAFSIINRYLRFVDIEEDKRREDWKLNDRWAWFIGKGREPLKLTTQPEPYTLSRTLNWIARQVAPTLKMLKRIDAGNNTEYLKNIEQHAKLTEKHEQIIKQQTAPVTELIEKE